MTKRRMTCVEEGCHKPVTGELPYGWFRCERHAAERPGRVGQRVRHRRTVMADSSKNMPRVRPFEKYREAHATALEAAEALRSALVALERAREQAGGRGACDDWTDYARVRRSLDTTL